MFDVCRTSFYLIGETKLVEHSINTGEAKPIRTSPRGSHVLSDQS